MKKRICLIGGNSLLGSKILEKNEEFEIIPTIHNSNLNEMSLDITKISDCKKILEIEPDIIVNTAAITDVDYCEKNKKLAYNVNVNGVENLVNIANQLECKLIHISTDGIFSGKEGRYIETDFANPINYYGKTKLESEKKITKLGDSLIFRTSVLYGFHSKELLEIRSEYSKSMNFALWVLYSLYESKIIKIVNDQFSNPTFVDNLVEIIFESIKKNLKGTYNATDQNCVNRYEFVQKIASKFGHNSNLILPVSSSELNQIAKRPSKTCLDCSKISKHGIKIRTIDSSLEKFYHQVKKENPSLISKPK